MTFVRQLLFPENTPPNILETVLAKSCVGIRRPAATPGAKKRCLRKQVLRRGLALISSGHGKKRGFSICKKNCPLCQSGRGVRLAQALRCSDTVQSATPNVKLEPDGSSEQKHYYPKDESAIYAGMAADRHFLSKALLRVLCGRQPGLT